jgi:Tol biopolymer transport system component
VRRSLLLAALALAIPASSASAPGAAGTLVFSGGAQGQKHVFSVEADGTGKTNLTSAYPAAWDLGPLAWSPDGSKIAYAQYEQNGNADIYLLDLANGNSRRQMTSSPLRDDVPTWSPDGRRIAFFAGTSVYVMNADGSDQRAIAHDAGPDLGLDWSVNDEIAYAVGGSYNHEVRVVRPDGSGNTSLGDGWGPAWSPDGSRIAFLVRGDFMFGGATPHVANRDGSGRREVSWRHAPLVSWAMASWSPDGREIAFPYVTHDRTQSTDLYAVEVDRPGERRLTRQLAPRYGDVSWSPDGLKVGFSSLFSNGWTFGVVNADGTCELHLDAGRSGGFRPGSGGTSTACANLALSGESSPGAVRVGRRLTYRIGVSNRGDMTATSLRVTARLTGVAAPQSITLRAGSGSCHISQAAFACDITRLGVRDTARIEVVLTPLRKQALRADIQVTAREVDPNLSDNRMVLGARAYRCSILGSDASEPLRGTRGRDVICSLGGNDSVRAGRGPDSITAGFGDDRVSAGRGRDAVNGQRGKDILNPGAGRDKVWGGGEDDYVVVLDGNRDVVDCGPGSDRVLADRRDRISINCERLERRPSR